LSQLAQWFATGGATDAWVEPVWLGVQILTKNSVRYFCLLRQSFTILVAIRILGRAETNLEIYIQTFANKIFEHLKLWCFRYKHSFISLTSFKHLKKAWQQF